MIKVLITDDHPVVRRGIRQILEDDDRIGLINEASDGKELINRMIDQKYDVILLDISLPGRSGLDMISQIKKIQPFAAVLVLSIHSEEMYALNALKYGASGYLTKSSAPEELIFAIHKVSQGEKYISITMAEDLAEMYISKSAKPYHIKLSARELEVLNLMAKGKTVVQISSELSLSSKTISTYRSRLLEKLNLKSTAELIRYALLKGL
jgi:two-component system, NarL family, invasion response regulator UvrY